MTNSLFNVNFMQEDYACDLYDSFGLFINETFIPRLHIMDEARKNELITEKTILICYEDIGSPHYVVLKHLYTEDDCTFDICCFLIGRHTRTIEALQSVDINIKEFDIKRFTQNCKISLINSSKQFIHQLKQETDILSSQNLVHPDYDFSFKHMGKHNTFSFYTYTMYTTMLGSC